MDLGLIRTSEKCDSISFLGKFTMSSLVFPPAKEPTAIRFRPFRFDLRTNSHLGLFEFGRVHPRQALAHIPWFVVLRLQPVGCFLKKIDALFQ